MSTQVRSYDISTNLAELIDHARSGEDVVVAEEGKPVARLVALPTAEAGPQVRGIGENVLGITYLSPDFDEPAWSDVELEEMGL